MKIITVKFSIFFLIALISASACISQTITAADKKKLILREDTLAEYARYMITDTLTEERMISDSIFTRTLVRALQIKNSFYYPFDSLLGVSRLYAPDSSFRIITWNLQFDDYWSLQRGAIQMRTKDGSLKLVGLHDASSFTDKADDSVRNKKNWIGAVYYNIIKTQYNGKNYYTLFGFDPYSVQSTKKRIEVMYFDERNEPVFGGPFFNFSKDSIPKASKYRFSIEYKKGARTLVNYIDDLDMILVDHLISESDEPENKWTYVPDGDNEGFKWENGKWMHIDKVFTFKLEDGQAPVGEKLLDTKGNVDEKKLQEKSDKNRTKDQLRPSVNNDN